jgi:PrtD family type I secretion system ABC transporter
MKIAGISLPAAMEGALRGCRRHFAAVAIFSLLINLLYLAPAIYMLQVYDRVVATGGKTTLLFISIALSIALMTLCALDMVRNRLLVRASLYLDKRLAPVILEQAVSRNAGGASLAMRDFDTIRTTIAAPVAGAIFDVPWMPVFLIAAFLLHFWIGIMAIASAAVLVGLALLNQRLTQKRMDIATQAMAAAHNSQQAAMMHASTIRGLGMRSAMIAAQLAHRRMGIANATRAQFSGGRLSAVSRFVRLLVQSLALGLGALLAIAGDISAGSIIAASILLSRALQPIDSLIGGWAGLTSSLAATRRLSSMLRDSGPTRIYTSLPAPRGEIELEQVGFGVQGARPVLAGVSLRAEPGQILGIVGPSGAGKTTLGKIIVGALDASVGSVRIDGAQLSDWEPDRLGRHFGYMPQESSLFDGTIKENIARFDTPAEGSASSTIDGEVIAAATLAGVHEMILQLPHGYDTRLGLGGSGLSAGQAQRVALARALYGSPQVLLLDEPNAFLDADGEASLVGALGEARSRGATVIVIAHRRGLLDIADRLLVIDGGRPQMIGPANDVVVRLGTALARGRTQ